MSRAQTAGLERHDVHPAPLVDGRPAPSGATGRLRRQMQRVLASQREREEAELERRIRSQPAVTRPNTIALISPKGGVGKTTSTFLTGNLLATHLKLRAIAVDANPDFGTLARLAPDERRSERSLADLLEDSDRLNTAAELTPYVSRLPTGLHVLGSPRDAELTASLGPERYGELVAFLATFYEVVLLDLGTGVAGPLARFAIERADQVVLVTTPEWVTSSVVLEALSYVHHDHTTVALNKSRLDSSAVAVIEDRFRAEHPHRAVTIPYDEQLATMLDSGAYSLDALGRGTRVAVKRLGLAVADQLV
jgi:MinD-like ATPase involved in chromosome partitioning or flagellar assembly